MGDFEYANSSIPQNYDSHHVDFGKGKPKILSNFMNNLELRLGFNSKKVEKKKIL